MQSALTDAKAARLLHNACKAAMKQKAAGESGTKRPSSSSGIPPAKRVRRDGMGDFGVGPTEMTPQELEKSLELPLCMDEEQITSTVLQTNRAPLLMAFAVETLRHTMPEQPLSSRLSLSQAVVSANSRAKAVSLGLEKGPSAASDGWGAGQPRVKVLDREITVMKRGGYDWRGEETVAKDKAEPEPQTEAQTQTTQSTATMTPPSPPPTTAPTPATAPTPTTPTSSLQVVPLRNPWAASQPISLKSSTFIARATSITDPNQRKRLVQSLLDGNPNLKTATHNAWAYRVTLPGGRIREESFDDGESGCGELMLRVMRDADTVDTLVVLTRWFGGIMLGPDRWRLMRNCVNNALSERLRRGGHEVTLGGEALWGLDLEAAKGKGIVGGYGSGSKPQVATGLGGLQIHRPEPARAYLLKSFATVPSEGEGKGSPKKKTSKAIEAEKVENLGLLLGALRIVLDSWTDYLTPSDLDKRAWAWYVAARPEIDSGPSGWGAKGQVKLSEILKLKRRA